MIETDVDHSTAYGSDAIATAADPASWELWPAPEQHAEVLYQCFPEFTCLCPRSSYPDFAAIHLVTVPHQKVVELKHLKLWFNSFRDRRISHELATATIVETLATVLDLHYVFILMEYTPRGNLTTLPMVEYQHPRVHDLEPTDSVRLALENARHIKLRLIDRVLGSG
ncbi:MAG: preQ(1) synthase [Chloroflexota bacterium]|nr:preQ(1) synthase [Chloroflexota bacterium]